MDYYIIWTGENEQFQKLVIDEFRKKGYRIYGDGSPDITFDSVMVDKKNDEVMCASWGYYYKDHKEITFRELCELPPVHDELEELAEHMVKALEDFNYQSDLLKTADDFCKLWEKMKLKLGL